jgi:hypothetical protein
MGSDIALEIMHVVGIGADPVARAGHVSFGHRIGVGSRTCTSGNPRATGVITSLTPRALAMEGERHRTVTVASAEHTLRRINEFVPPAIDENRGLQNDDGAQPARKPPAKTSAVLALTSNVLARGGIQSIRDRNRTGAAEAGSPRGVRPCGRQALHCAVPSAGDQANLIHARSNLIHPRGHWGISATVQEFLSKSWTSQP